MFFSARIMDLALRNPTLYINVVSKRKGVNSFWMAAKYGHGMVMNLLANSGINIMSIN
jgi:hypothetical protein